MEDKRLKKAISTFLVLILIVTSFCFTSFEVEAKTVKSVKSSSKTVMSSKVGSKTVKFNANGGIVAGALKTKKGHVIIKQLICF
ncbi:hypothetical protein MT487_09890 [Lachnospiraceae bacterium NSJ-171]|jgi:hypothetical protein|nr:hypothetical protein [Lachnospiraceae bacterium NSJ-171]